MAQDRGIVIWLDDEDVSSEVQQFLFSEGYAWAEPGGSYVHHLDKPYIVVHVSGIRKGNLCFVRSADALVDRAYIYATMDKLHVDLRRYK